MINPEMYLSFLENLEIKVTKLFLNSTYTIKNSGINIMLQFIKWVMTTRTTSETDNFLSLKINWLWDQASLNFLQNTVNIFLFRKDKVRTRSKYLNSRKEVSDLL